LAAPALRIDPSQIESLMRDSDDLTLLDANRQLTLDLAFQLGLPDPPLL
jgi:hypothetical protein